MNKEERQNIRNWINDLREMETKHLPELDHKDCGELAEILEMLVAEIETPEEKCWVEDGSA